jgi:stalled ribosome alternative rescue factor ArfA
MKSTKGGAKKALKPRSAPARALSARMFRKRVEQDRKARFKAGYQKHKGTAVIG